MLRIVRQFKPDLMAGTDLVITHVGKLLGIPSIIINEDDAKEVPLMTKYGTKYCSHILAPNSCDCAPYNAKKIPYPGYHELAYLHPNTFTPDPSRVEAMLADGKPFFILRFAQLTAHHDKGKLALLLR